MDFPIKNLVIFYSHVKLPEGTIFQQQEGTVQFGSFGYTIIQGVVWGGHSRNKVPFISNCRRGQYAYVNFDTFYQDSTTIKQICSHTLSLGGVSNRFLLPLRTFNKMKATWQVLRWFEATSKATPRSVQTFGPRSQGARGWHSMQSMRKMEPWVEIENSEIGIYLEMLFWGRSWSWSW